MKPEVFSNLDKHLNNLPDNYKLEDIVLLFSKALIDEFEKSYEMEGELAFQIKYLAEEEKIAVNKIWEHIDLFFQRRNLLQKFKEKGFSDEIIKKLDEFLTKQKDMVAYLNLHIDGETKIPVKNKGSESKLIDFLNTWLLSFDWVTKFLDENVKPTIEFEEI